MNTDFGTHVSTAKAAGFTRLSGQDLLTKIAGKSVFGDYGMAFKYVSWIDRNGTVEGKNNFGAHVFGSWAVDRDNHTLSLLWDGSWDNTITQAYYGDGQIRYYDIDTGNWRTTFTRISDVKQYPLVTPQ